MELTERHRQHWLKNKRMTWLLLLACLWVTFGVSYFARALDFYFFGWPFSFWMGAQGSLIVYGLIIGGYAWYMEKLDRRYNVMEHEAQDDDSVD